MVILSDILFQKDQASVFEIYNSQQQATLNLLGSVRDLLFMLSMYHAFKVGSSNYINNIRTTTTLTFDVCQAVVSNHLHKHTKFPLYFF